MGHGAKEPIFYVNGEFLPQSQAKVAVSDLGLLRGYGVFDFTRTYGREPFRLRDHLERFLKSARLIELEPPWGLGELEGIVHEALGRNPGGEMGIRIVATGGESADSLSPSGRPSLIVIVKPIDAYPREFFTEGVRAITYPAKRDLPEAKTLNYATAVRALRRARLQGAHEAIYSHGGLLYECMVCSFFAVRDGKIITAGSDVLDGITRRTVLELVRGKIAVEYRFVKASEIPHLEEAFLTSSGHGVMPIVAIDGARIGDGRPGPITREVMGLFEERIGRRLWE
ncbi:MAG: aminotransferase class IV [Candidatus Bathyarchaeia archaeon]